ncbi:MAG TPA: hypothetical protein VGV90_01000 [Solirubrobacteraceae bacterium]|nr:hypothetical protein [Solirubrobacteraceae bacterium]
MRASRWEILGAWLRMWTPPRDVEIPPIPWRAVGLLGVAVAAVVVVIVLAIAPALDRSKDRVAASEQRRDAAARRAEVARLRFDQRVQRGRAPSAARLYRAGREADAQAALERHAAASVQRDARARVAAGEFDVPVRYVRCRPRPGATPPPRVRLSCLAVTTQNTRVRVGQPFIVAGSLRDGRYAWCHTNPPPGEGAAGVGASVALSAACKG